jgi:mannitol/fructose-specific phosphotransferase system IIA component (Ntr-type)
MSVFQRDEFREKIRLLYTTAEVYHVFKYYEDILTSALKI